MEGDLERRINVFVDIVDKLEGNDVVNSIYHIITTYGIPKIADSDFLIACLMQYYIENEEYEKCNVLKTTKFKMNIEYNSFDDLSEEVPMEDIKYMTLMGFFKSIPPSKLF
jgi:hypothetical protein